MLETSSSFYTCVPKITVIWCTVPKIRSETDRIFIILGHFCPFTTSPHLIIPKIKILEKKKFEKNVWRCYPFIHTCVPEMIWFLTYEMRHVYTYVPKITITIYGSWDMECDRQKFLSVWAIVFPFSPLTTRKIKIFKLKKAPGDIIILHRCTINENHMMYGSWDIFCHVGLFFALLSH